jgi:hypothetical protein
MVCLLITSNAASHELGVRFPFVQVCDKELFPLLEQQWRFDAI